MSTHLKDADAKAAKLTLHLKADSGFTADAEYRISANQWSRILMVAEDEEKGRVLAAAPELLEALHQIAAIRKKAKKEHCDNVFNAEAEQIAKAAIAKATGDQK